MSPPLHPTIAESLRRALDGSPLSAEELLSLASLSRTHLHDLLHAAGHLRRRVFGDAVVFCSIIPGKLGGCTEDCAWCAQPGKLLPAARTPPAEIAQAAADAAGRGARCFGIVNSGRRPAQADLDALGQSLTALAANPQTKDLPLCASLGELTGELARDLARMGIRRYNHNLETSRAFFPSVVKTHSYQDRLNTLAAARQAGMELCCGGIFGLGESWPDRVDLAVTLREQIHPAVVPLNFLHPIPGTALGHLEPLPPAEILAIIAVFRFAMPKVDLKIAGGRQHNLRDLQSWIFHAGATSCIIGNYLTTPGRQPSDDLQMIADLGLNLVRRLPTEE